MTAFEAYRQEVVVGTSPRKIESLVAWDDHLAVGLADGCIMFFKEQQDTDATNAGSKWQVGCVGRAPRILTISTPFNHRYPALPVNPTLALTLLTPLFYAAGWRRNKYFVSTMSMHNGL